MDYKINEIAKLYNISKEMVRYYERCGVIFPQRSEDNNYRIYSMADFFALGEAIQLTQFGIKIRDTKNLVGDNFIKHLVHNYNEHKKRLDEVIHYNEQLRMRCSDMLERIETSSLNFDSFWIKKIPERFTYPYQKAKGDRYEKIFAPMEICHWFLSAEYGVFSDASVEFMAENELWSFSIDKKYADVLNPPEIDRNYQEAQICLCTVIDMGEFGEFSKEKCQPLLAQAREKGLTPIGNVQGILCGRGSKDGTYRRHMELRLPIMKQ